MIKQNQVVQQQEFLDKKLQTLAEVDEESERVRGKASDYDPLQHSNPKWFETATNAI